MARSIKGGLKGGEGLAEGVGLVCLLFLLSLQRYKVFLSLPRFSLLEGDGVGVVHTFTVRFVLRLRRYFEEVLRVVGQQEQY